MCIILASNPRATNMNPLLWDAYRKNATAFVHEWAHERDEKGEAHSYWDAFLKIFYLERRRFARHKGRVKRKGNRQGFMSKYCLRLHIESLT